VFRKIGDRGGEAHTLRNIGDTLQDLNQMKDAAKYWHQALTIFEDLGDEVTAARIHANLTTLPPNHGTPIPDAHES
jgi:hypothetical protein